MIKHSPAAIADSSLCSQRESKRSTQSVGSRRLCGASRAAQNGKRIATPRAADMTTADMVATAATEEAATHLARDSSIRPFVPIAGGRRKFHSCRARTNRFTAGTVSRRCGASSSRDIPTTSPESPFIAFQTAVGQFRPRFSSGQCFHRTGWWAGGST